MIKIPFLLCFPWPFTWQLWPSAIVTIMLVVAGMVFVCSMSRIIPVNRKRRAWENRLQAAELKQQAKHTPPSAIPRRFQRGAKRSGRFGIMNNHRKYQQDENNQ